jgi:hypothetical protein
MGDDNRLTNRLSISETDRRVKRAGPCGGPIAARVLSLASAISKAAALAMTMALAGKWQLPGQGPHVDSIR